VRRLDATNLTRPQLQQRLAVPTLNVLAELTIQAGHLLSVHEHQALANLTSIHADINHAQDLTFFRSFQKLQSLDLKVPNYGDKLWRKIESLDVQVPNDGDKMLRKFPLPPLPALLTLRIEVFPGLRDRQQPAVFSPINAGTMPSLTSLAISMQTFGDLPSQRADHMVYCRHAFITGLATLKKLESLRLAFDIVLNYEKPVGLDPLGALTDLDELEVWSVISDVPHAVRERFFLKPVQEAFGWLSALPKLASLTTNWDLKSGDLQHFMTVVPLSHLEKLELLSPVHLERAIPPLINLTNLTHLVVQPAFAQHCVLEHAEYRPAIKLDHLPRLAELTLLNLKHEHISATVSKLHAELLRAQAVNLQQRFSHLRVINRLDQTNTMTKFRQCDCPTWKPKQAVAERFKFQSQPDSKENRVTPFFLHVGRKWMLSERPAEDGPVAKDSHSDFRKRRSALHPQSYLADAVGRHHLTIVNGCTVKQTIRQISISVGRSRFLIQESCALCRFAVSVTA